MYTIQAVIGNRETFERDQMVDAKLVALPFGLCMIPFAGVWMEAKAFPFLPMTDEGTTALPASIAEFCHRLSSRGKLAYIEAEFFGGQGTQACILWEKGKMISNPRVESHAINYALQFLGVDNGLHADEFDAIGLGKYRSTEDWLSVAGA